MSEDVLEQLKSASRMYYRFDTDMEAKKKPINILADILEKVRDDLKETLNQEYDVSKNEHDRLIFGIVNELIYDIIRPIKRLTTVVKSGMIG